MRSGTDTNSSSTTCNRYAVFRFVTDPDRDVSVPVGVAIWGSDPSSLRIRLPATTERFKGMSASEVIPFLSLLKSQIEGWLKRGEVPYQAEPLVPLSEVWWEHVRRLMQFRVRIDEPRPMECISPDREIEALYEAVAKPRQPRSQRKRRVETALKQAIGKELDKKLGRTRSVPGWSDRSVEVLRATESRDRRLVVEIVNLAYTEAERDADAMASKVQRIKEGPVGRCTDFLIGYIASPNGLNGEGTMKNWLELKSGTRLYDVERERATFADKVSFELQRLGSESTLQTFLPEDFGRG